MTPLNSREKILANVRQSLEKTETSTWQQPLDYAPLQSAVNDYINNNSLKQDMPLEPCLKQFIEQIKNQRSSHQRLKTVQELPTAIANYQRQHAITNYLIKGWQEFAHLDWRASKVIFSSDAVTESDLIGLTGCAFAVAETGTIAIINQSKTQPLKPSLLPEHHIAVVRTSDIFPTLFYAAKQLPEVINHQQQQLVFISGASRTADIEQTLVMGAHGPRAVHLIIVDN